MKKQNINGRISYNQYKLVDIMLFLVIMAVFETINVFAIQKWFPDMLFSVSLMFTVSLIAMVRWNFLGAIFPPLHGALYCLLVGAELSTYVIYIVGNCFLILSWLLFKLIPKEKLFSKWYLSLIYPLVAFVLVLLGRTAVAVCFGHDFVTTLGSNFFVESLNIVFAIMAILILRRVDGMLADQKQYLLAVSRQRQEARVPKEDVWAGYTELDEDELKKLHGEKEEGDGISMYDEYPPDSR